MTKLDWERARRRQRGPRVMPAPVKSRGISNDQARELGRLCRALGLPYRGQGMSYAEARAEIARLRK